MSEDNKLTIDDPISEETFNRIRDLGDLKATLCQQYVDLDNEKIRLQVTVRKIDEERERIFSAELQSRGLSADTTIEIDGPTRKMRVLK